MRSLFWEEGTYSGPIGPGAPSSYDQPVSIDSALQVLDRWLDGVATANFDVRILRTDLRQQGDLAAAWIITRRRTPSGPGSLERDWVEHLVLRRIDGDWRILNLSVVSSPRGGAR